MNLDYNVYKNSRLPNGKTTRLYKCWQDMKSRCYNGNNKNYIQYGGRGIIVCEQWEHDYQKFRAWAVENGYKENLTLDRVNFNGNYEPTNCRWVSIKSQQHNKRNNRFIEFKGEIKTLSEWCEKLNLNKSSISSRINRDGVEPLIALGLIEGYKAKDTNYFTWDGMEKSYSEWVEITGVKMYNVHNRILNLGWSVEEALELKNKRKH